MFGMPFNTFVLWWMALAVVVFIVLFFISAPYGRHTWLKGPALPGKVGWLIMECPSSLLMAWWFITGTHHNLMAWIFIVLWEIHYVQRSFIFPLRMKGRVKPMPLLTALMAVSFNVMNAWLVSRWLFTDVAQPYETSWLLDPRFLAGTALFAFGYYVNYQSDAILLNLRKPGESGYKIPKGGLYRWVSCPNYFGELMEWFGFALATWSLPALAFAVWSSANLVPRALTNHKWYRQQFAEYPGERRAVIPFVL